MIIKIFDHPMFKFILIATFSVASAHFFWMLGGSAAKIVAEDNKSLGLGIELGGAIAGFVAVFWISLKVAERLHGLTSPGAPSRKLKIFLVPRELFARDDQYVCDVSIYNEDTGDERTQSGMPRRENGHLTIDLRDLSEGERFQIQLRNSENGRWISEYCHPSAPSAEMKAR